MSLQLGDKRGCQVLRHSASEGARMMNATQWQEWQIDVVNAVRVEFRELFSNIEEDDFDWDAWRFFYEQGYRPLSAVQQAFSVPR